MMSHVPWPTRIEYDLAVLEWSHTLQDPELRRGQLARDQFGLRRYGGAGLYVCLYRVDDWLVRCFCCNPPHEPPADIEERYTIIERFCREAGADMSALIPVTFQSHGIQVGTRMLPIVKMPFVRNAVFLGRYVELHRRDRTRMAQLVAAWQRTIGELEAAPMAHGDLDLTNVLVQDEGGALTLRLIDYDNLWLPELAGRAQTEYGHEPFQHPAFLPPQPRPYSAEMDRFSALVIYLSLKALEVQPALYDEWGADDTAQLLLAQSDYRDPDRADGRLAQLARLPGLSVYAEELRAALRERRMPRSLAEVERNVGAPGAADNAPVSTSSAPAVMPLEAPARPSVAVFDTATYAAQTQALFPAAASRPLQPPETSAPTLSSPRPPQVIYTYPAPSQEPPHRGSGVGTAVLMVCVVIAAFGAVIWGANPNVGALLSSVGVAPTATNVEAPTATATPTHRTARVTVNATDGWQDAQVFVNAGDHVRIAYVSGKWSYSPYQPLSDGKGPPEQYVCARHYAASRCDDLMPGAVQGSLIGSIGTQLLKVGDGVQFTAGQTGELNLAINDGFDADNRGSLTVQVTVN